MAEKKTPPPKMERVMHIARLMAAGEYRTRLTEMDLREKWGISERVYREHSAEASRLLRLDPKELDQLRVTNLAFLERVQQDSMQRLNRMTGLPDYRSALEATKMQYEYVIGDNKRQGERAPEDLSDDELRELAKKATAMLLAPTALGSEKKDEREKDGGGVPASGPEGK